MDGIEGKPKPNRPGLPLDPLLQLAMGEVRRLPDVTWTGGSADPVAPENPMRVCLFTWNADTSNNYNIAPSPGPVFQTAAGNPSPGPVSIHCRDYPGVAQGAWVGSGVVGTTVSVAEYTLLQ